MLLSDGKGKILGCPIDEKRTIMYNENTIQKLDPMQHVRLRPGMYFGGVDVRAMHHLVHEILDDVTEEALTDFGDHLWITIRPNHEISIRDNGSGIPVEISKQHGKSLLELSLTNVGAKINRAGNKYYFPPRGMMGVGIAAVNALSSSFTAEVAREGYLWRQVYGAGVPQSEVTQVRPLEDNESTGTIFTFTPDFTIFEPNEFQFDLIAERARELSYLIPGLTVVVRDERTAEKQEKRFYFPQGLGQLVTDLNAERSTLHEVITGEDESIFYAGVGRQGFNVKVDFALQYADAMDTIERSYANRLYTANGGTHVSGLYAGLTGIINEFGAEAGDKPFTQREIAAGLTIAVSIRQEHVDFERQTRIKLITPNVFGTVAGVIYTHLRHLPPGEIRVDILEKCRANRKALHRAK